MSALTAMGILCHPIGLAAQRGECNGRIVSRIEISRRPPFASIRDQEPWDNPVARFATRLHAITKSNVIKRYLLLKPGDVCTTRRLLESGRILRAQPFLAEAEVQAVTDDSGGVVIQVTTVDEVSLLLDGNVSARSPHIRHIGAGMTNLGGNGVYAGLQWRYSEIGRDAFGARAVDYQFLGKPYHLEVEAIRNDFGSDWFAVASQPFLTDLQKISWRMAVGKSDGYRHFQRSEPVVRPSLWYARSWGDIGAVARVGPPGEVGMLGISLSGEREIPGAAPVVILPDGVFPDTSTVLSQRYQDHHVTRINLLAGYRRVEYIRVTGFETLEALQDVRTGLEAALLIGKGIPVLGGEENDLFVSTDVYFGMGNPNSFAALEIMGEARKPQTGRWDGTLSSSRVAYYNHPGKRHTLVASAEWSGAWRVRLPFQLTFSDKEGGLRGYRKSVAGGSRRLIASAEERYHIGRFHPFASLSTAAFVEVGRLWEGHAPFGVTTPFSPTLGVSLLAAIPPRSHRLSRLDVAFPLRQSIAGSRWEVRFTNSDLTRVFWREPSDIRFHRERSIPTSIFNYP
jgi:hypothetical protein